MGNWNSIEKKLERQDEKVFNIQTIAHRLDNVYSEKYLDPDFCNQVTMISNEQLLRFQHQKVDGRSYSFGYIGDVPHVKQMICEGIQEEYRLKKALISEILECFKECNSRIDSITRGPICRGNPEIFNKNSCSPPSVWLETIALPDRKIGENQKWFDSLDEIHYYFMKNLTILENMLYDLENHDDYYSIDRIKDMTETVSKIKINLHRECSRLQKLILTIPTYTKEEVLEKNKIELEKKQRETAKKNSLLNGLDIKI
jgi:hypothetical protein